jgi:amidophosphoribosyltransferase
LKDACTEAASSESGVNDFEVGVFLGQYKTEIPDGYLEDLNSRHPEGKKRKNAFTVDDQDETRGRKSVMVASSSPVNVAGTQKVVDERPKDPERQEDVRYVI